jgi:hypothetical protein
LRAFLAAAVVTALASFAPAQAADGQLDGWKLAQWSREEGNLDVCICKSAVRIFIAKSGLVVLACAPWKEVDFYCTKTGKVFKTPMAKFHNPWSGTMALWDGGGLSSIDLVLKGPIKIKDIPCQMYVQTPGFSRRQMARYTSASTADRSPMTVEYAVSDDFKTAPQVGQIVSRFYALPSTSSLPIQFTYTSVVYRLHKQLTMSACKKAKFKASDFKLPPGLKIVNDGMAVIVPDNSDGGLDLMMMGRSKVK